MRFLLTWLSCDPAAAAGPSVLSVQYLSALHRRKRKITMSCQVSSSPVLLLTAVGNLLPVKSVPLSAGEREASNRRNPIFRPEREAFHRCPAELEVRRGRGGWREAGRGVCVWGVISGKGKESEGEGKPRCSSSLTSLSLPFNWTCAL